MPELPEVETVRRKLSTEILNKRIVNIEILYVNIVENDISYLIDKSVKEIKRNGKYLLFLIGDKYLVSHLRMEGKFYYKPYEKKPLKHEHVRFVFADNMMLTYHDTRKFGRMKLIDIKDESNYFEKLGLEPKKLDIIYLKDKLKNKNKSIKTLLLDQSIIAGLGNIYANEVLYLSKVDPFKKGKDLTNKEIEKIIISSQKIIEKAINEGGSSIKSYTSSLGVTGNYQNYLKVHMQNVCENCKSKIIKEKLDGRNVYYCSKCQK